MNNIAIIAAAGNGERLNCNKNKMLIKILDKPLLAYTLNQFEETTFVKGVILVIREKDFQKIMDEIINKYNYKKIIKVIAGGATRQESIYCGLNAVPQRTELVCIHDGARPFVKDWMIEKTFELASLYDGAIVAIPASETIKQTFRDKQTIKMTLDREKLWIAQTPQAFKFQYLKELYERAISKGIMATDDSSIVEYFGGKVKIIVGERENIKITTPIDIMLAEMLLKND